MKESQKFNPLRAKADSFGFRRGYFLKIKVMELAEVKKYFENADQCLANFGNEFKMNKKNFKSIHKDQNEFYVNNGQFQIYSEEKGFAKILTTKEPSFSITKEQLRQLTDPKVKEWFPEVFEVKLEVGKWYKNEIGLFYITKIKNNIAHAYGFQNGIWKETGRFILDVAKDDIEATEQEVFEALKNEAVKRGFVEGIMFESVNSKHNHTIKNFELDFEHFKKALVYVEGWDIFKNGIWATIIQTITKSEAEKLLNKKIID